MSATFVWYELMTTDAAAAQAFYGDVIGWAAQPSGTATMPYIRFLRGTTGIAGLFQLDDAMLAAGARPAWIGYLGVPDLDAALAAMLHAGGTQHRAPAEIPDVGRFAVVADPQGAPLVLFTPAAPGPARPTGPGAIAWHELMTDDGATAFAFYTSTYGWTPIGDTDLPGVGTYRMFAAPQDVAGGILSRGSLAPASFWKFYIHVDAIHAATARVRAAGGTILREPTQVPGGGWIVQAIDPQGAFFALTGPAD